MSTRVCRPERDLDGLWIQRGYRDESFRRATASPPLVVTAHCAHPYKAHSAGHGQSIHLFASRLRRGSPSSGAVVSMYRAGTRRVWGQRIVPVECNWGGAGRRPSASGPEIRSDVVDAMRSDASRGCGVAPFEGLGDPAGSLGPQEGHTLPPRGIIFSASISLASHAVAPAGNSIKRP